MKLDSYTFHARLTPVFIVLMPLGLTFISYFPFASIVSSLATLFGTISAQGVLTLLFSEIGRDLGKRKEPWLYEKWGGMPTDFILSLESTLDRITVERYKRKLNTLSPDILFPTDRQERNSPTNSRNVYRSCANLLKEKTRDKSKFPLIQKENISYGFRRNLWGMKPAGIVIALFGVIATAASFGFTAKNTYESLAGFFCLIVNVLLLVWWLLRITPSWVKVPGDEYAKQLFAASEIL